jgi:diguanylate cyclase (GGDEF)-like protein
MALIAFGAAFMAVRRSRNKEQNAREELESAFREVQHRVEAEQKATLLAESDSLTGLANRRHLHVRLHAKTVSARRPGSSTYLLLLDLDSFKPVNDIHGHAIGDQVLIEVAERLCEACSPFGTRPVRLGGDEFAILLNAPTVGEEVERFARDLINRIGMPYEIDGRRLTIGCTIGIARQPEDGDSLSKSLRSADRAMYEAKRAGRRTFRFFAREMDETLRNRSVIETALRNAIQEEAIQVVYQPIYRLSDDGVAGFEALARWTDVERGVVPPDEFIPIAEGSGLIEELTFQFLRRDAATWPEDVGLSVNLSPVLLRDEWIATKIQRTLAQERLAPERLTIEITENAAIDNVVLATSLLHVLREAGVRVVLDDFGKGHSSLSQLRDLPLDGIKMDSSFALSLEDPQSMRIITAIAGMAAAMELPVTAEGIETRQAVDTLKALGFRYGQGYLLGRAMDADAALELAQGAEGRRALA